MEVIMESHYLDSGPGKTINKKFHRETKPPTISHKYCEADGEGVNIGNNIVTSAFNTKKYHIMNIENEIYKLKHINYI
jgi:hypothetical protein